MRTISVDSPPPLSTTRRTAVPRTTRVIAAASLSRCVLGGARETTSVVLRPDRPLPPNAAVRGPPDPDRRQRHLDDRSRSAAAAAAPQRRRCLVSPPPRARPMSIILRSRPRRDGTSVTKIRYFGTYIRYLPTNPTSHHCDNIPRFFFEQSKY